MLKKFAFLTVFGLLIGAVALVLWQPSLSRAQGSNCASEDYSAAQTMLSQGQEAMMTGDVINAMQLQTNARTELRRIFHDCAVVPMLQERGFDEATIASVAEMPFCEYRFEATVRSGPNSGLALMGTLALMQNTPTTAVGYVYALDETSSPVPVSVEISEENEVTLTFMVAENTSIVGTGYFTAGIESCFGGVEGVFSGPTTEDVGDWIGLPCTLNPSSMSCTPAVSLDPNQLPILRPQNPIRPERDPNQPPPMCAPIRDAACVAACGTDASCRFNCPTVGEMCS